MALLGHVSIVRLCCGISDGVTIIVHCYISLQFVLPTVAVEFVQL